MIDYAQRIGALALFLEQTSSPRPAHLTVTLIRSEKEAPIGSVWDGRLSEKRSFRLVTSRIFPQAIENEFARDFSPFSIVMIFGCVVC